MDTNSKDNKNTVEGLISAVLEQERRRRQQQQEINESGSAPSPQNGPSTPHFVPPGYDIWQPSRPIHHDENTDHDGTENKS